METGTQRRWYQRDIGKLRSKITWGAIASTALTAVDGLAIAFAYYGDPMGYGSTVVVTIAASIGWAYTCTQCNHLKSAQKRLRHHDDTTTLAISLEETNHGAHTPSSSSSSQQAHTATQTLT